MREICMVFGRQKRSTTIVLSYCSEIWCRVPGAVAACACCHRSAGYLGGQVGCTWVCSFPSSSWVIFCSDSVPWVSACVASCQRPWLLLQTTCVVCLLRHWGWRMKDRRGLLFILSLPCFPSYCSSQLLFQLTYCSFRLHIWCRQWVPLLYITHHGSASLGNWAGL